MARLITGGHLLPYGYILWPAANNELENHHLLWENSLFLWSFHWLAQLLRFHRLMAGLSPGAEEIQNKADTVLQQWRASDRKFEGGTPRRWQKFYQLWYGETCGGAVLRVMVIISMGQ